MYTTKCVALCLRPPLPPDFFLLLKGLSYTRTFDAQEPVQVEKDPFAESSVPGEKIRYRISHDDGLTWDNSFEYYNPGRAIEGRACPRSIFDKNDSERPLAADRSARVMFCALRSARRSAPRLARDASVRISRFFLTIMKIYSANFS